MKIQSLLFTLFVILFSSFNCYADSSPLEEQYNFSFYENSNLQLLNVCVYQGKLPTNKNLGTKIIKIKKDNKLISSMETISLEDYSVGEGLQYIKTEHNLLEIQQSYELDGYIICSILYFKYSNERMFLEKYEERRFNRFSDKQKKESKILHLDQLIDMNDFNDDLIYKLHYILF